MKKVWTVTYEDNTPGMDGPHLIRQGEWESRALAEAALKIMESRSDRAPKKNLRLQWRRVSDWRNA